MTAVVGCHRRRYLSLVGTQFLPGSDDSVPAAGKRTEACRGRWFRPSCHVKKVVQSVQCPQETIFPPVPHGQYIFTIPKILHRYFLIKRKLPSKLNLCAVKSLTVFLQKILVMKVGVPVVALSIQTQGDFTCWHPHFHAVMADDPCFRGGKHLCYARSRPTALGLIAPRSHSTAPTGSLILKSFQNDLHIDFACVLAPTNQFEWNGPLWGDQQKSPTKRKLKHPDEFVVMAVDGAPWHRVSFLHVPKNMKLLYLTPYILVN
jgi:hypothetical protein